MHCMYNKNTINLIIQIQVIMLSRFIETARVCSDLRNFAGCLAILDGLENILVRQLPVSVRGEHNISG